MSRTRAELERGGKLSGLAGKAALSLSSLVVMLLLLEGGVRGYYALSAKLVPSVAAEAEAGVPLHRLCDCPYLYGLNPEHPEVSSQGLRDREYAIPKPAGITRILVLGDSVPFGVRVPAETTFPKLLEEALGPGVEIVNAGVQGYTAYNELQYYLEAGRQFEADVVLVAFSLNDVVNPRRHINYAPEAVKNIPEAAIPNLEYDRAHVVPTMEAKRRDSPLEVSALFKLVDSGLERVAPEHAGRDARAYAYVDGKRWPTFITGEDTISIKVLMDYQSAEWRWLGSIYDELGAAVAADGATMAVLMLPLAYQLDPDYPYLPQELLAGYFDERGLLSFDLLPAFREHRQEALFFERSVPDYDVWHLTERGHVVAAEALSAFLAGQGLVPGNLR